MISFPATQLLPLRLRLPRSDGGVQVPRDEGRRGTWTGSAHAGDRLVPQVLGQALGAELAAEAAGLVAAEGRVSGAGLTTMVRSAMAPC